MVRSMRVRSRSAERFVVVPPLASRSLEGNPHVLLARLRGEPVSWLPALGRTRRDLALQVMRDARTFTVDDARFPRAGWSA